MEIVTGELDHQGSNPLLDRSAPLRRAVMRLGLICLDREWRGTQAQYRFQCPRNHVFSKAFTTITQSRSGGCRQCVEQDQDARLFTLAAAAGVTCQEPRWLGVTAQHRFRCAQGHEWVRSGARVLGNASCPSCRRSEHSVRSRRHDGLLKLQATAAAHGGTCLASEYLGGSESYAFRCAQGHVWETKGNEVIRRTWCPECARLRKVVGYRSQDGLAQLRRRATERGGVCLSDTYEGGRAYYRMRCAKGHEWTAPGRRILRGGWCLKCAYDAKRLRLEDMLVAAKARGGQCLSATYVNNSTKLHWVCHRGHSWHAPFATIRAGHWCPECAYMAKITNAHSKARRRYAKAATGDTGRGEMPSSRVQ